MQIRESSEEGQLSAAGARCLAMVKRGRHGMVYQAGTAMNGLKQEIWLVQPTREGIQQSGYGFRYCLASSFS